MKPVLGGVAVLAAMLLGLWLLPPFLSQGALRGRLVAAIERRTGRTVTVGHLELALLPFPSLRASDIALGGPSPGPAMLHIDRVRAVVAVWPLLRHVVRLHSLRLDGVTLHLLRGPLGPGNWQMTPKPGHGGGGGSHAAHWTLELDSVAVDAADLSLRDARARLRGELRPRRLEASGLRGEQRHFRLDGLSHGAGYVLRGTVGRRAAGWPMALHGSETVGGKPVGRGTLSGTLAGARGYDLTMSVTLSDLAELDRLFTHARLPAMRDVTASLHVVEAGHPALVALRAQAGATEWRGVGVDAWHVVAAGLDSPVQVAAKGSWKGRPLLLDGTAGSLRSLDAALDGEAASLPVRLALGLDGTRWRLDGRVGVSAGPGQTMARPLDADLSLHGTGLVLGGQSFPDAQARLVLLRAEPRIAPRLSLSMQPMALPAALLSRWLGMPAALRGTAELVGRIDASGDSRSSLIATATGHLGVSVVDGSVTNQSLAGLIGHGSAVAALLPRDGGTALCCLALHGTVAGGQVALDSIALRTTPLSLDGHGAVALGGGLDLRLLAQARVAGAAVSMPVSVSGSAQDPRVVPDRAAPGGRYVLTIAPQASDDCGAPLAVAREGLAGPAPQARGHKKPRMVDLLRGLGLVH